MQQNGWNFLAGFQGPDRRVDRAVPDGERAGLDVDGRRADRDELYKNRSFGKTDSQ